MATRKEIRFVAIAVFVVLSARLTFGLRKSQHRDSNSGTFKNRTSVAVGYNYVSAQCLKYTYAMLHEMHSDRGEGFGFAAEVIINVLEQLDDGDWLIRLNVKNPRHLSSQLFVVKREYSTMKKFQDFFAGKFYFTQDSNGLVKNVYYSNDSNSEGVDLMKGIVSGLSINLTLSHNKEYESEDVDSSGQYLSRFTVSPVGSSGSYFVSKTHRHEDYASFSQETYRPGERVEERHHFVRLENDSFIRSSHRRIVGSLPDSPTLKKDNLFGPDNFDLKFHAQSKLDFEGICDGSKGRSRRNVRLVLESMTRDSLPIRTDIRRRKRTPVKSYSNGRESDRAPDADSLIKCIESGVDDDFNKTLCMLSLIDLVKEDKVIGRRVVDYACVKARRRDGKWMKIVQLLGSSHYGQKCLVDLMSTGYDQFVDVTHVVDDPLPDLLILMMEMCSAPSKRLRPRDVHKTIMSLGRLARLAANVTLREAVVEHLENQMRLSSERDDDLVAVYAHALGNAGQSRSFALLYDLTRHRLKSVRSAALYAMRELDWRRVEPVLINVVVDENSTETELRSVVKVMLRRSEDMSTSSHQSLVHLYHRSIGRFDRVYGLLDDFFRARKDDKARRAVERADRRRDASHASRALRKRAACEDSDDGNFDPLRPLVDELYGIDKKFGKTFGTSKANAGFSVEFKNLAQIYVSLFGAKIDFQMNNVAKGQIVAFGKSISLFDGEIDFDAGLSYKNEIASDLLNTVVDTAVEVVGAVRNALSPIVKIVIRGIDFFTQEFSDIDRLVEPVQPFIRGVHEAVDVMDVAINVSVTVQDFIGKAKQMISNFGSLDFAYKLVHRVVALVEEYVKEKLVYLEELCLNFTSDVLDPIARARSFVANVSHYVVVFVDAIESFSADDLADVLSDLAESILHFNRSAQSDGATIVATLRRYVDHFSNAVNGTTNGEDVASLSDSFSTFVNVSRSLIDGLESGFNSSGKQVARQFEKIAEATHANLMMSQSSVRAFRRQLQGYSALSRLNAVIDELKGKSLFHSNVSFSIGQLMRKLKPIQTKICSVAGETLDSVKGFLWNITHLGNSSFLNMTGTVVGFLRSASSVVFDVFSMNASMYNSVDVFKLVKDLVAKGVDLLSKFIDDKVLGEFNETARHFADRVGNFVESEILEFAKNFSGNMNRSMHYLQKSEEFFRFLNLAKEIADYAVVVAKGVPEIEKAAKTVSEVLDKVVDIGGWVKPILEHVLNSSSIVGVANESKIFVVNLLDEAIGDVMEIFADFKATLMEYVRKAANVALERLSGDISYVQSLIDKVLPTAKKVVDFVDTIMLIESAVEPVADLLIQMCAFGDDNDTTSALESLDSSISSSFTEWNDLINATSNASTVALVKKATDSAQSIESLPDKILAFEDRLGDLLDVHSGRVESYVDLKCSPHSLCTRDIFVADVKTLVADAEEIIIEIGGISEFFEESSKIEDIVDEWSEQISSVVGSFNDLIELVHSSIGAVVDLVNKITDAMNEIANMNFHPFGAKDDETSNYVSDKGASGFPGLDFLHEAVAWMKSTWFQVKDDVTHFLQPVLDDIVEFSRAVTTVCDYFSHISFIPQAVGPVLRTIDSLRTVATKMQNFLESAFFPPLDKVTQIILKFRITIVDVQNFVNGQIIRRIDEAIAWLRVKPLEYINLVRKWVYKLLLVDAGLEEGELPPWTDNRYCDDSTCMNVKPRSSDFYRTKVFPLKYTHFEVLCRQMIVIPGLFENYQVQGVSVGKDDGSHVFLSMFGTSIHSNQTTIIAVQEAATGDITRLYRLFSPSGERLYGPFGFAVAEDWVYIHALQNKTDNGTGKVRTVGVLYGVEMSTFGDVATVAPPLDVQMSLMEYTDSFGTGMFYDSRNNLLWIADCVRSKTKTSLGTKLPLHHVSNSKKEVGWAAAYATEVNGQIIASQKYDPSDTRGKCDGGERCGEVLKPSLAVTIGFDVVGFLAFENMGTEYLAYLRCAMKPGYSCKLDYVEKPQAKNPDDSFKKVPIHFGQNVELQRAVRVPDGAIDISYVSANERIVVAHNSGAQEEQERRLVVGADLEDSTFFLDLPVLKNRLDLKKAITANNISLTILGKTIVNRPLISLPTRKETGPETRVGEDFSDCINGADILFSKTTTFFDTAANDESIILGEFFGVVVTLDFSVKGRLSVSYNASLCVMKREVEGRIMPEAALIVGAAVSIEAALLRISIVIDVTIMDTTLVPALFFRLEGRSFEACGELDLVIRPLKISVSLEFDILGPKISCPSWKLWECKVYIGVYYKKSVILFQWSANPITIKLLPQVCYHSPDYTAPVPGTVTAKQNDASSMSIKWMKFSDQESEVLFYTVSAESSSTSTPLFSDVKANDSSSLTLSNLVFLPSSNVVVTVTCRNMAGLTTSVSAEPFTVDLTAPVVVGLVDGTNISRDLHFDHSRYSLAATFNSIEEKSTIVSHRWGIGKRKGSDDVQAFTDTKNATTLTNSSLQLEHNAKYFITILTLDSLSNAATVSTTGVLIDLTPPLDGSIHDNSFDCSTDHDYQIAEHSFKVCWSGIDDLESGVDHAEWNLIRPDGTSEFDYINVGHSTYGFRNGLRLHPKIKYIAVVRVWNRAGLPQKTMSDGFIVDYTNPVCGRMIDVVGAGTNDVDYASSFENLGVIWTCDDPESGVAEMKIGVGTSMGASDVLKLQSVVFNESGTIDFRYPSLGARNENEYFAAGYAVNRAGLIYTDWSDGVMIDATPPYVLEEHLRDGSEFENGGVFDVNFQLSDTFLCARWPDAFADLESPIVDFYIAVQSDNGSIVMDELSVGVRTSVCLRHLALETGTIYKVLIRAENEALLSRTNWTDGVLIDATPPMAGILYDGQTTGVDADYSPEADSFFANYKKCLSYRTVDHWPPYDLHRPSKRDCLSSEFRDDESGISHIETSVFDSKGKEITPWAPAELSFETIWAVISGGRQGELYRFALRVYNRLGNFVQVVSNGTIVDTTPPIVVDLIEYDYNMSQSRRDIDYYNRSSVDLGACWSMREDVYDTVLAADWAVGSYRGGFDALDFNRARGNNDHALLSNLISGVKYFVSVKATNGAGLETRLTSDGFLVDDQPPTKGVVYDGWSDSDIDYQASDSALWCHWRLIEDVVSGLASLDLAASDDKGETTFAEHRLHVDDHRGSLTTIGLITGVRYFCVVKATDKAGLVSISVSDGVVIDRTPPFCPGVVFADSASSEGAIGVNGIFEAHWDSCYDNETKVRHYELEIVAAKTMDIVVVHDFATSLRGVLYGFSLTQGASYYAVVRSINFAGMSTTVRSSAFVADFTPPVCTHVGDGLKGDIDYTAQFANTSSINWLCEDPNGLAPKGRWSLGVYRGGFTHFVDVEIDARKRWATESIHIPEGVFVYSTLTFYNHAGLKTIETTNGYLIDESPPVVEYVYDGSFLGRDAQYQSSVTEISAHWSIYDTQSGLIDFTVALISLRGVEQIVNVSEEHVTFHLSLEHMRRYEIEVLAENGAGLKSIGASNGVLVDATPPVCTFVKDGFVVGKDVDFVQPGESIAVNWNCFDAESNLTSIVWIAESETSGTTPVVCRNEYLDANVDFDVAKKFRQGDRIISRIVVTNGAYSRSEKKSDGVGVDVTPPTISQLEAKFILKDAETALVEISWTARDNESGVESFFAVGTSSTEQDRLIYTAPSDRNCVHCVAATAPFVVTEFPTVYYVFVRARNEAEDESIDTTLVIADATPPVIGGNVTVRIVYKPEPSSLSAYQLDVGVVVVVECRTIFDEESAISDLEYAIGREDDDTSQLHYRHWYVADSSRSIVATVDTALSPRTNYRAVIRATNGAGQSRTRSSDIFQVGEQTMTAGVVYDGAQGWHLNADRDYQPYAYGIWARWKHFRDFAASIVSYSWGIGSVPNRTDILAFSDVGLALSAHNFKVSAKLLHAHTYYVVVRALSRSAKTVSAVSDGITIDLTAPTCHGLGFGFDGRLEYVSLRNNSVWVTWKCTDSESSIYSYNISIGSSSYSDDLYGATFPGNVTRAKVARFAKERSASLTGYLTVGATNWAGLSSTFLSNLIVFDFVNPVPGLVDVEWKDDELLVNWTKFHDDIAVHHYVVKVTESAGLRIAYTSEHLHPYISSLLTFQLNPQHGMSYRVLVKAYDEAGNRGSGLSSSITFDLTNPEKGDAIVRSPLYYTENDTIRIEWENFGDNETEIIRYVVSVGTTYDSSILTADVDSPSTSYDLDSHCLTPGVKYYVFVTAINAAFRQARIKSEGLIVDRTPPSRGSIRIESSTFDGRHYLSSKKQVFNVSWSNFVDEESGIASYDWSLYDAAGNCIVCSQNVGQLTSTERLDIILTSGQCYVAFVRAWNNAGLSIERRSESVVYDSSSPTIDSLTIGGSEHVKFWNSTTSMRVSWLSIRDGESRIRRISLCIQTVNGKCDVAVVDVSPKSVVSGFVVVERLSLTPGESYTAHVIVKNAAGMSARATSKPTTIDSARPVRGFVSAGESHHSQSSVVECTWHGFRDSGSGLIVDYQWGLGTSPGNDDILSLSSVGFQTNISAFGIDLTGVDKFYHVLVAFDSAGMSVRAASEGVVVDNSPPIIRSVAMGRRHRPYGRYEVWKGEVAAHWRVVHMGSPLLDAAWSVCTDSVARTCPENGTKVGHKHKMEVRSSSVEIVPGLCYYVVLRVRNRAGLVAEDTSKCTVFDSTPPSRGRVFDAPAGHDDVDYLSIGATFSFSWSGFDDKESPVDRYSVCVGTSPRMCDAHPRVDDISDRSIVFSDFLPRNGVRYFATVYAVNKVNLSRWATSDGVLVDATPPATGAIRDGLGKVDMNVSTDATTVSANWKMFTDSESGIVSCRWWAGSSAGASDIVLSRNLSVVLTSASSTGHEISSGMTVYVSVECLNGALMKSSITSDGYVVGTTSPKNGSVFFRLSGVAMTGGYLASAKNLTLLWKDFKGEESPIVHYSYAMVPSLSETTTSTRIQYVDIGLKTKASLASFRFIEGVSYRAAVRAYNKLGLFCESLSTEFVGIDSSPPESGIVVDGPPSIGSNSLMYQSTRTELSAHWFGFDDRQSGVERFEACWSPASKVNTSYGCRDVAPSQANVTFVDLFLVRGERYVVQITAINGAGRRATTRSSGVLVDLTAPEKRDIFAGSVDFETKMYQSDCHTIRASWRPFVDDESGIDFYTWTVQVVRPYSESYIAETNVGLTMHAVGSNFTLPSGAQVFVYVRGYNRAGLFSTGRSNSLVIDTTPPAAGQVFDGISSEDESDYFSNSGKISAYWHDFSDPESDIAGYAYELYERVYDNVTESYFESARVVSQSRGLFNSNRNNVSVAIPQAKAGYLYWFTVTALNGAGLKVVSSSDGARYLPNDLCFRPVTEDDRGHLDVEATSSSNQVGVAVLLSNRGQLLCPSDENGKKLSPQTKFSWTVIRGGNDPLVNVSGNFTAGNGTAGTTVMEYEPIGTFLSSSSRCCFSGPFPLSVAKSDSQLTFFGFSRDVVYRLVASDVLVVADSTRVAFLSLSDDTALGGDFSIGEGKRRVISITELTSSLDDRPIVVVLYDDLFQVFLVNSSKRSDLATNVGALPHPALVRATRFCAMVGERSTDVDILVSTTNEGLVLRGRISLSPLKFIPVASIPTVVPCKDVEMSSNGLGALAIGNRTTGRIRVYLPWQGQRPIFVPWKPNISALFTSAVLLPRTNFIAVTWIDHSGRGLWDLFLLPSSSESEVGILRVFRLTSDSSFGAPVGAYYDVKSDFGYMVYFVPAANEFTVILIHALDGPETFCQIYGYVILPMRGDVIRAHVKNQTIVYASAVDSSSLHFTAFCLPNNSRIQIDSKPVPVTCEPCRLGKRSSGGTQDDCTLCLGAQCLPHDATSITSVSRQLNLTNGADYRLGVTGANEANRVSVKWTQPFIVDWTPPIIGLVYDGHNKSDKDFYPRPNMTLSISWMGFYDRESDIDEYRWCVGTQPLCCDVAPYTSVVGNVSEVSCDTCEFLANVHYYSTIMAVNRAGLTSMNASNGFLIDITPPLISYVRDGSPDNGDVDYQKSTTFFHAHWHSEDKTSSIREDRFGIGSSMNEPDVHDYKTIVNRSSFVQGGLHLTRGKRYFAFLRATNGAGLSVSGVSDGVIAGKSRVIIEADRSVQMFTNDFDVATDDDDRGARTGCAHDCSKGIIHIPANVFRSGTQVQSFHLQFESNGKPTEETNDEMNSAGVDFVNPYEKDPIMEGGKRYLFGNFSVVICSSNLAGDSKNLPILNVSYTESGLLNFYRRSHRDWGLFSRDEIGVGAETLLFYWNGERFVRFPEQTNYETDQVVEGVLHMEQHAKLQAALFFSHDAQNGVYGFAKQQVCSDISLPIAYVAVTRHFGFVGSASVEWRAEEIDGFRAVDNRAGTLAFDAKQKKNYIGIPLHSAVDKRFIASFIVRLIAASPYARLSPNGASAIVTLLQRNLSTIGVVAFARLRPRLVLSETSPSNDATFDVEIECASANAGNQIATIRTRFEDAKGVEITGQLTTSQSLWHVSVQRPTTIRVRVVDDDVPELGAVYLGTFLSSIRFARRLVFTSVGTLAPKSSSMRTTTLAVSSNLREAKVTHLRSIACRSK